MELKVYPHECPADFLLALNSQESIKLKRVITKHRTNNEEK